MRVKLASVIDRVEVERITRRPELSALVQAVNAFAYNKWAAINAVDQSRSAGHRERGCCKYQTFSMLRI